MKHNNDLHISKLFSGIFNSNKRQRLISTLKGTDTFNFHLSQRDTNSLRGKDKFYLKGTETFYPFTLKAGDILTIMLKAQTFYPFTLKVHIHFTPSFKGTEPFYTFILKAQRNFIFSP